MPPSGWLQRVRSAVTRAGRSFDLRSDAARRAVSPVVGVALMIVLVVLLASIVAGLLLTFDDLEAPEFEDEQDHPWSDDTILGPENPTAGATDVRYRVYFEIADPDMDGDALDQVRVYVDTGDDMFSGTGESDLDTFEVETVDGTEMEIDDDVDGWEIDEGGSELVIELDGSGHENPSVGDVIVVVFGGVDNPDDPGTYDVAVELNGDEDEQDGELEIVEG